MDAHRPSQPSDVRHSGSGASAFTYDSAELDVLARARNYYSWILDRFRPYLRGRVVEVGAGIGTFSERILALGGVAQLLLVEPAVNNIPILRQRFDGEQRVEVVEGYLEELGLDAGVDVIVLVNVLEHIEKDREFLAAALRALRPGGHLLVFVPAVQGIFGSLDERFGHYRRYSKALLQTRARSAGFSVDHIRYVNLPGVLAWFLTARILRRDTLSPRMVHLYDRWVLPIVFRAESFVEPPIGQNLLLVASRPT